MLLGIPSRGVPLAQRVAEKISSVEGYDVPVGSLDITMYRDDLRLKPARTLMPTEIPPGGVDGKIVVLVDDVLFSGRTIRAALDALSDVGRPQAVRLAVLIDRGHRELPIRADFVGKNLPTSLVERVRVSLEGVDDVDAVTILGTVDGSTEGHRHEAPPAERGRPDPRRRRARAADRRGDALPRRPADQEAARAARPDRGQPLLRGLHPHPDLVRGGRQAALAPTSSTSPPRARRCPRARASRTPRSPSRRWAPTRSWSATPRAAPRTGWRNSGWVRSSVVNAGDGTHEHPTQALLDAFTMWRHLARQDGGGLDGRRVAIVGDVLHSRVARSNALLLHTLGAEVTLVAPPTLLPVGIDGWPVETSYDLDAVIPKADVVMMLRVQRERMHDSFFPTPREYSRRYGLDGKRMATLQDHTIVMHPGPMVRGMEITADVADSRPLGDRRAGHQRRRRPDGRPVPAAGRLRARRRRRRMSTTYLIQNAALLGGEPTDLLLEDGVIKEIGQISTGSTEGPVEIVDATGLIALPGLVDLHTHLREPGREDAETVESGTHAAALGGFTAVHAMANTDPVADTAGVVEQVWRLGREAGYCDVYPVGAVTVGLAGERLAELGAMADSAARVRVFSDDGKCVSDPLLMRRALEYVKAFDGVIAQHAQEPRLTEDAQMNEGELSGRLGLAGWPAVAEEAIIARDCLLAAHVGSRLHVCHVSTAGSVEIVRQAKEKGWNVTAEVCPHHLLLTDDLAATYDPIYKVNPPLRSQRATSRRCAPGWPTAPSTSSPPTTPRTRTRTRTASGPPPRSACSASRPRCRSCRRRWSTPACSTGPASPSGCPTPRPGSARSPSTARAWSRARPPTSSSTTRPHAARSRPSESASLSRNTPYAGMELPGRVVATFLRGKATVLDGKLT